MQALVDSFWGQYRHWMNLNGQYKYCTSPPRPIQALDHFFQEPMYATKHSFNSRWRHCLIPIYVEWCRHETILSRVICNYLLKPLHALNELICMDNVGSRWPFSESIQAFVQPMQGSNDLTCMSGQCRHETTSCTSQCRHWMSFYVNSNIAWYSI